MVLNPIRARIVEKPEDWKWSSYKSQLILGENDFVDSLSDHLKRHKDVPKIPKSRRFANRPELDKIFTDSILRDKHKRDRKIAEAVEKHGYTQRSIADHLGVHFTYVSRILRKRVQSNNIDPDYSQVENP